MKRRRTPTKEENLFDVQQKFSSLSISPEPKLEGPFTAHALAPFPRKRALESRLHSTSSWQLIVRIQRVGSKPDKPTAKSDAENVQCEGFQIWSRITNATDRFGRTRASALMNLPPSDQSPGYYSLIKKPVSFNNVKQRIEEGQYSLPCEVMGDLSLVLENARKYYHKRHIISRDIRALLKMLGRICKTWTRLPSSKDPSNELDQQAESVRALENDRPLKKKRSYPSYSSVGFSEIGSEMEHLSVR